MVESALSGERPAALPVPHRLAPAAKSGRGRPPGRPGRKLRAGHPRPSGHPGGSTRCQRPARLKFGPARMGPALGRAASQGGRGAPAGRPRASRPARDSSVRTEWWLCLRLASGLAGWQSQRPAGRPAGHAEKAAGHLVKRAGRARRPEPGQVTGHRPPRPSGRPGSRPPDPDHSVECAGTSKSG